jgi:hypothetical protein
MATQYKNGSKIPRPNGHKTNNHPSQDPQKLPKFLV